MKLDDLLNDALMRLEWPRLMDHLSNNACFDETKTYFVNLKPWVFEHDRLQWVSWTQLFSQALENGLDLLLNDVPLREFLEGIRIGTSLSLVQLQHVQNLLILGGRLSHFIEQNQTEGLKTCFGSIPSCPLLIQKLQKSLDGRGGLQDNASLNLRSLRSQVSSLESAITHELDTLINKSKIRDILQDHLWMRRDGHFVLPIKVEHKNEISGTPKGLSGSGATVFIEPASLNAIQNKLDEARTLVEIEEMKIIHELSQNVHENYIPICEIYEALLKADKIQARAQFHRLIGGCWPQFHTNLHSQPRFYFKNAKHPLYVLEGQTCVENTMALDEKGKIWVLSGPNAGGKTVVMRTVGLLHLMALAGLSVTAYEGVLYKAPYIFADLGDRQSRIENLSTFSGHLDHINSILKYATEGSLVLLDECFVGTDPEMGMALARSTLEYLESLGVTVVITTHFDGLKKMSDISPSFVNASMEFSSKTLSPTYRLLEGIPGKSYAFELASRMGFPKELIEKATEYYGTQNKNLDKLITELNQKNEILNEKLNELNLDHKNIVTLKSDYQNKIKNFDKERKMLFEEWNSKVEKRLNAFQFTLQNSILEDNPEDYINKNIENIKTESELGEKTSNDKNFNKLKILVKEAKKNTNTPLKDFNELSRIISTLPSNDDPNFQSKKESKKISKDQAIKLKNLALENANKLKKFIDETKTDLQKVEVEVEEFKSDIAIKAPDPVIINLKIGDKIFAKGFSTSGILLTLKDNKGQVLVDFNGLKVKIPIENILDGKKDSQLKPPSASNKKSFSQSPHQNQLDDDFDWQKPKLISTFTTCDLRGMTAEYAIDSLEKFLDKKLLMSDRYLFIIHGHGMGKVKSAVREYLKSTEYIKRYRPGVPEEGGDGVTVVEIL